MAFKFDKEKAIAAVLHIANELKTRGVQPAFHKIFKILYFAEQEHLAMWGRPITGDDFVAMEAGPVPSRIYDILKCLKGGSSCLNRDSYNQYFEVSTYIVTPKQLPNLEELSDSDLSSINVSIEQNWKLSFGHLCDKSHGPAWKETTPNRLMDIEKIAKEGSADPAMIEYIRINAENSAIFG